jgi:hypothetical protein
MHLGIGEMVEEPLNGDSAIVGGDARDDADNKDACRNGRS